MADTNQKFEAMLKLLLGKVQEALGQAEETMKKLGSKFSVEAGGGPQAHQEQFFQVVYLADHLTEYLTRLAQKIPPKPARIVPQSIVGAPVDFKPTLARSDDPDEVIRAKFENIIYKFVQIFQPRLETIEQLVDQINAKLNTEPPPAEPSTPLPGARSVLLLVKRIERV